MMQIPLFWRNLFFTLVQPGLVVGLFPYLLLEKQGFPDPASNIVLQIAAVCVGLPGLLILLDCIRRFQQEGKGTLSPADPTRRLVGSGLYRFSRNPMYLGVMAILIGEALFYSILPLWLYSTLVFVVFHLFIVLREEPRLLRDFGPEYAQYCSRVRRWL